MSSDFFGVMNAARNLCYAVNRDCRLCIVTECCPVFNESMKLTDYTIREFERKVVEWDKRENA